MPPLTYIHAAETARRWADYFLIGVAVNQRNVTNAEQQALIKRGFSSMTAENDMKPEPTEPRQGQFNWEG